jgi:hypothetical protein
MNNNHISDATLADYVSGQLDILQYYAVYLALQHDADARARLRQICAAAIDRPDITPSWRLHLGKSAN